MSKTTAKHFSAIARGEVKLGEETIGRFSEFEMKFSPSVQARAESDLQDELEKRYLRTSPGDIWSRSERDKVLERRPPKQKPKVAPFPSNLDMALFNAPENLARWAAQTRKVMEGLR